jgi:hypothetical protein
MFALVLIIKSNDYTVNNILTLKYKFKRIVFCLLPQVNNFQPFFLFRPNNAASVRCQRIALCKVMIVTALQSEKQTSLLPTCSNLLAVLADTRTTGTVARSRATAARRNLGTAMSAD